MSDSESSLGNRRAPPRVFRPFKGAGTPGQGIAPAPQASSPKRLAQPFRPFAGAQRDATSASDPDKQPAPVTVVAAVTEGPPTIERAGAVASPAVDQTPPYSPTPQPFYHVPEPAPIAHEAWERYVAPEPEPEPEPEPSGVELPQVSLAELHKDDEFTPISAPEPELLSNSEITVEVPQFEDAEAEFAGQLVSESGGVARPPITVEVPAIPSDEAMAAIRDVASEGDLWESAYVAAPAEQPTVQQVEVDHRDDVVIDEVEAAFESARPPSDDGLDDILMAAATIEAIARRLRNGEIDLRPAPGANMSSEETALATVLAALLANR